MNERISEEMVELLKGIKEEKELQNDLIMYFLKNANEILSGREKESISEKVNGIGRYGRFSKYYG